jgi:hypothetical protein
LSRFQATNLRKDVEESRKREHDSLVALAAVVPSKLHKSAGVKRGPKKKGTTLGNDEKAKAMRKELVELVRSNASKGKEVCSTLANEAGFLKKEVEMFLLLGAGLEGIKFEGESPVEGGEAEKSKKQKRKSSPQEKSSSLFSSASSD